MKKIISLFQRNYDGDGLVRDEVVPGAEWVVAGEGRATRKWDGTCCLVQNGFLYKRYEVKVGRVLPPDFTPAAEIDPETGKQQGWVPVGGGPEDRWHREAFVGWFADGTYELLGPKVQANPEKVYRHVLVLHGAMALPGTTPRDFDGLRSYLAQNDIEGIVWHHPLGRMVKIKAKDFGIRRATVQEVTR